MSNEKQKKAVLGIVQGFRAPEKEEKAIPARKSKTDATETPQPEQTDEIVKMTIYVPKPTHKRIRIALAHRDDKLTFNGLTVQLLKEWAEKQD